jgi:hypothetical protein
LRASGGSSVTISLVLATILLISAAPALSPVRVVCATADGDEEAAVYSTILNERFAKNPDKSVVVADRTFGAPGLAMELDREYLKARLSPLSQATIESYKGRNKEPLHLKGFANAKVKYSLMTEGEWEELFEKDILSGWKSFRQRYADAAGVVRLSRVGFNPEGTQALVLLLYGCGEVCGEGTFILLTKEEGGWRIEKSEVVVVA